MVAGILALAAAAIGVRPAEACLWISGTSVHGGNENGHGRSYFEVIARVTDPTEHNKRKNTLLGPTPPDDAPVTVRSDHAALLVYQDRAQEAIAILEAVEKQHPGEYVVAANLGTAYELAGNNQEALRWIQEGIRRNPDAHEGTEWVHVKILEAKIARAGDPRWLETHTVLGLDFGNGIVPVLPAHLREPTDINDTTRALEYQLHERLGFVKPPEPIVGALLADLANLTAIDEIVEQALPIYDLALAYQPPHAAMLAKRRAHLAGLVESNRFWNTVKGLAILIGVLALCGLLVFLVWRRRRRRPQGLTAMLAATSGSVISAS